MILSYRHRFIFFCNGKTGTTSIEQVLEPMQEGSAFNFGCPGLFVPKHVPPAMLRGCLPAETWNNSFKFVFVRNPFDWFVSQWRYNQSLWPKPAEPKWWRRQAADPSSPGTRLHKQDGQRFDAVDIEFLFNYLAQFRGLPGAPGLLQSSYVADADGRQIVDYVGRFESLQRDWSEVCGRLGLNLPLPHLNRSERAPHGELFTDDGRASLERLWSPDLERFGYRFERGS